MKSIFINSATSLRFYATLAFSLVVITGCASKEEWLHCQESRGWETPEEGKTFYLNFKYLDDKTTGLYVDDLNSSSLEIRENPKVITVSASIYQFPMQSGFSQVIYRINRQSLKFSKTTRVLKKDRTEKIEDIGGITISQAGFCKKGKKPIAKI
jgi:hypothetical protein